MGAFENAFDQIKKAVEDMATLEVVSYKGRIELTAEEAKSANFQDILDKCAAQASLRITACTRSHLDGDIQAFYHEEITMEELEAHLALVETAQENRQAMVELFGDAIGEAVGRLHG